MTLLQAAGYQEQRAEARLSVAKVSRVCKCGYPASLALLVEGVLNQQYISASEAQRLSGEAPPALLVEGVLNPNS
jgi:hypothetical protein